MQTNSVQALYLENFRIHGVSPWALGLRPGSQEVRFAAVMSGLTPIPSSLIDLGCGFGDLLSFLRKMGWQGEYLGVDLIPEFIAIAREKFCADSSARWVVSDVIAFEPDRGPFEACVCLGLCNQLLPGGNLEFINSLVRRGMALTSRFASFDFLSTVSDRRRQDLYFMDPTEALKLGMRYSRRVTLDHSYMPFEFLLKIRTDDAHIPELPYFAS